MAHKEPGGIVKHLNKSQITDFSMTDDHSFSESDTESLTSSVKSEDKKKKGRPSFKRVWHLIKFLVKRNFWTFNAQFYIIIALMIYYFTVHNKVVPRALMFLYRQLIKFESN